MLAARHDNDDDDDDDDLHGFRDCTLSLRSKSRKLHMESIRLDQHLTVQCSSLFS